MAKFTTENAAQMGRRGHDATAGRHWLGPDEHPVHDIARAKERFHLWWRVMGTIASDPVPGNGAFAWAWEYVPPPEAPAWAKQRWRMVRELRLTLMGINYKNENYSMDYRELRRRARELNLTESSVDAKPPVFWFPLPLGGIHIRPDPGRIATFIRLCQEYAVATMRGEHILMLNMAVHRDQLADWGEPKTVDWQPYYEHVPHMRPGTHPQYVFLSEWLAEHGYPLEQIISLPTRSAGTFGHNPIDTPPSWSTGGRIQQSLGEEE